MAVMETATPFLPFAHWEGFYVIVGTSAAALLGLQFVVMTLIAEFRPTGTTREIDAFGTPTIVHLCAVLLVSAILAAPWHAYAGAAIALGICGAAGAIYAVIVIFRGRRVTSYTPVLEDWIFHGALPLLAYSTFFVASIFVARGHIPALFVVAATTLLLMFVGIHNAWDTVTFVTIEGRKSAEPPPSA
jgi:hypothetical protein